MIACGHSWSEIQNYSFATIKLFLEAAHKLDNQRRAASITDLRLAAWGEGKQVSLLVEKLNGD